MKLKRNLKFNLEVSVIMIVWQIFKNMQAIKKLFRVLILKLLQEFQVAHINVHHISVHHIEEIQTKVDQWILAVHILDLQIDFLNKFLQLKEVEHAKILKDIQK